MSSLLDQAIVDAEALKEAAMKNAESAVLEKYSVEIKEAVNLLLNEQGPDMGGDPLAEPPLPMPPMDQTLMGEESGDTAGDENVPEVPPAEGLCPCPDIEEQIDGRAVDSAGEVEVELTNVAAPLEEVLEIDFDALEEEILLKEDTETQLNITPDLIEELLGEEDMSTDIPDELIDSIVEKIVVDIDPQKSGWLETPISDIDLGVLQAKATEELVDDEANLQDTDNRLNGIQLRQVKELQESHSLLNEENDDLTTQSIQLTNENKKIKTILMQLKDKLNEVNLSNAKLLYTNRILSDSSLNERQRNKIVESLAAAITVNEAKVIFETLQSTVGASYTTKARRPETLSEVVNKASSNILPPHQEKTYSGGDATYNRMKLLAGINKN
jgi:hypothetical protein